MPYLLDYTDPSTTMNYPESFWLISAVSLNQLQKSATITFDGFQSVTAYNEGPGLIAQKQFVFNDTDIYSKLIEFQFESVDLNYFSFYSLLELAINETSGFFQTGFQWSACRPIVIEIGAESDTRLNVLFSGTQLGTTTDFLNGVSIDSATFTGADLVIGHPTEIYYDLSAPVMPNQRLFWSYDQSEGAITDIHLLAIRSFKDIPVNNSVGSRLNFSMRGNSGHAGGSM